MVVGKGVAQKEGMVVRMCGNHYNYKKKFAQKNIPHPLVTMRTTLI